MMQVETRVATAERRLRQDAMGKGMQPPDHCPWPPKATALTKSKSLCMVNACCDAVTLENRTCNPMPKMEERWG